MREREGEGEGDGERWKGRERGGEEGVKRRGAIGKEESERKVGATGGREINEEGGKQVS